MGALSEPFDLMGGLDPQAASDLVAGLQSWDVEPGEEIDLRDDDATILVSQGRLSFLVEADADAQERTVTFIDSGELLVSPPTGWGDEISRISCRAVTDSIVVPVDRRRFTAWMANPTLAASIVRHLAAQVAERSLTAATALEPGVERRVLLKLHQLAARYGRPSPHGTRLDMKLTHQQIAGMVGAVRESVTIALGRLHSQGDIIVKDRTIWIPDGTTAAADTGR